MQASVLIDPLLPSLKLSDSVDKALEWMSEYSLQQLAVAENNQYKGLVSEDVLQPFEMSDLTIADVPLEYSDLFVSAEQHIFEIIRLLNQHDLSMIAVVDTDNVFAGSATALHVYKQFGVQFGSAEHGATIELKIAQRDYSLAEISRLVETNGVKIISSYYFSPQEGNPLTDSILTLKLNQADIASSLATLERYGYTITGVYGSDPIESIDQQRLDSLLRYLAT